MRCFSTGCRNMEVIDTAFWRQFEYLCIAGNDRAVRHIEEEAVFDDADDCPDGCGQLFRVRDRTAFAVENQIPFVGDVLRSILRFSY
jgi:hypothetical protein